MRLTAFALAMLLSTGWGSALVHTTAVALGLEKQTATQQPPTASTPDGPMTQSGCSMDPWGCPPLPPGN